MRRALAFLALAMSGCAVLASYPDPGEETSYEACHDGSDDDFDDLVDCRDPSCAAVCIEQCDLVAPEGGRVDEDQDGAFDCDDRDCDGRCPEDTLAACDDGRDQDGDGLIDLDDAGCWAFADVRIESCTSVAAVERVLDFDGPDETWARRGDVLRPDPTGRFPGDSLVVTSYTESGPVTLSDDIASTVVGLRLTSSIHFDPAISSPVVTVNVRDVSDGPTGYLLLTTWLTRGGAGPQLYLTAVGADGAGDATAIFWEGGEGWYDLELAIPDAQHATARLTNAEGDEVASNSLFLTRRFDDSHRFEVSVDPGIGAGTLVVVGELRWHGEALTPCGVEVPSSASPFRAPITDGAVRGDEVCMASSLDGRSMALARSSDRGLEVTGWGPGLVVPMRVPLALAYAPDGTLAVLGQETSGIFPSGRHFLYGSDDCTRLTEVVGFDLPGPRVVGMTAHDDGTYDLVRTNTTRAQGAEAVLDRMAGDGRIERSIALGTLPPGDIRASVRGNDVLFVNVEQPGRIAVISAGPRTMQRVTTLGELTPSGRAGACDEQTVLPAVLALDASPVVSDAIATGLVIVPLCDPMASGLVAHRLTVRPHGSD